MTAKCAKLQGRAVYALPGNVDVKTSEVTNLLIKNGAKLITDATDIVKDFEYSYLGRVNPFGMSAPLEVSQEDVLKRYAVSCVTPSDSVFKPSKQRSSSREDKNEAESAPFVKKQSAPDESNFDFDDISLEIYKKIPENGDIAVESLADENINMRCVMRTLLKLEMGRFIVMLPGEKVKRNI
jgi:predicted Rossmann fold nucleotide-binding protein DprA/Smf involved in DNA uptake